MLQLFTIETPIMIDGDYKAGRIGYLWDSEMRTWEISYADVLTSAGRYVEVFEEFKDSYCEEWDLHWEALMQRMHPGSMCHGTKVRQLQNKAAQ